MVGSFGLVTKRRHAPVGQCANQMIRYSAMSSLTLNGDAYIDRGVEVPMVAPRASSSTNWLLIVPVLVD